MQHHTDKTSRSRTKTWDGHHRFEHWLRENQATRAYRYVQVQPVGAGLVRNWRRYPHVRVNVELAPALARATELKAFLDGVPYKRYGE